MTRALAKEFGGTAMDRNDAFMFRIARTHRRLVSFGEEVADLRASLGAVLAGAPASCDTIKEAEGLQQAIAAETERFYALMAASSDLPGVRDGQLSGLGIALEGLGADCGAVLRLLRTKGTRAAA